MRVLAKALPIATIDYPIIIAGSGRRGTTWIFRSIVEANDTAILIKIDNLQIREGTTLLLRIHMALETADHILGDT